MSWVNRRKTILFMWHFVKRWKGRSWFWGRFVGNRNHGLEDAKRTKNKLYQETLPSTKKRREEKKQKKNFFPVSQNEKIFSSIFFFDWEMCYSLHSLAHKQKKENQNLETHFNRQHEKGFKTFRFPFFCLLRDNDEV